MSTMLHDSIIESLRGLQFSQVEADLIKEAVDRRTTIPEQKLWAAPVKREDETTEEWFSRVVGEGIGAASTAWDSLENTGVFHDVTARSIFESILRAAQVVQKNQDGGLAQAEVGQVEYVDMGMRVQALSEALRLAGHSAQKTAEEVIADATTFEAFLTRQAFP